MEFAKESNYSWTRHDKLIFNEKGDQKLDPFVSSDNNKEFETVFKIFSGNYECNFGYVLEKKQKKEDKYKENYFYRLSLEDLSQKLVKIDFPKFPFLIKGETEKKKKDDKETWGIVNYNKSQFLMLNKQYSKLRDEDQYNIAFYDYDGNLKKSLNLHLELKDKYFSSSKTGFGGVKFIYSPMVSVGLMEKSATGNLYLEADNESFYIYGLYTNRKNGDVNIVSYNGFYIYKFNAAGELIWKQEKEIEDDRFNSKQRPIAVTSNFIKKPNGQFSFVIDSFYEKYALMFDIDGKLGTVSNFKDLEFKIEGNRLEGINVSTFPTGYFLKELYPNLHFDKYTLFAMNLNPKISDYLAQYKTSKEDINFNTQITNEGFFIIQENEKSDEIKLLKFDW
jgi:hypothetical protein